MATVQLNCLGMKCPQPILKVVVKIKQMNPGDVLEVEADCPSFPTDIKAWAEKTGKTLMLCSTDAEGNHSAQIQL